MAGSANQDMHKCAYEDEEFPLSSFGRPRIDGRRKHRGTEHFDDGTIEYDPPDSDIAQRE